MPTSRASASQIPLTDFRRLQRAIVIVALLPLVLFAIVAHIRYLRTMEAAREASERYARIGQEHAAKVFDGTDVLLERLLDLTAQKSDALLLAEGPTLHRKLKTLSSKLPQVQSIWVLDHTGRPLLTDRFEPAPRDLNLSDRSPFLYHKAGGEGTYISDIRIGRRTGEPFFDMTRARRDADGNFIGTVQVSLHPGYFSSFYREVTDKERSLTVSIVRDDGALLARWPEPRVPGFRITSASPLLNIMRRGDATGAFTSVSAVDGVQTTAFARKLSRYPVYVYAGNSLTVVQRTWHREIWPLGLLALTFSGAILAFGFYAVRQANARLSAAGDLQREIELRERSDELLRHAQKMEALGHLCGGIAHDFNNLLMVVQMNAQVLAQTQPTLTGNARLESIQRTVTAGARLTRQLLGFSRRQPLTPEVVSLDVALPAVGDLCRTVLGSAIKLSVRVEPDTPQIRIDPAELELAILNLAINAKHAMPEGGKVELVAGPCHAHSQLGVEIRVADNGNGIPEGVINKIFDPFFTTKLAGTGTGLGLSQVQSTCLRAGGSVYVVSNPNSGTTFYLRLPGHKISAQPIAGLDDAIAGRLPNRILLVEDNPEIADATASSLRHAGCTVTHCDSGLAARLILDECSTAFDLVLSDIVMPGGMDGIDLVNYIRSTYPRMPTVLMSGYSDKLNLVEQLHLPVIAKPFTLDALRKFLDQSPSSGQTSSDTSRQA